MVRSEFSYQAAPAWDRILEKGVGFRSFSIQPLKERLVFKTRWTLWSYCPAFSFTWAYAKQRAFAKQGSASSTTSAKSSTAPATSSQASAHSSLASANSSTTSSSRGCCTTTHHSFTIHRLRNSTQTIRISTTISKPKSWLGR